MNYPLVQKMSASTQTDILFEIINRDGAVIISGLLGRDATLKLAGDLDPLFERAGFCDGLYFGRKTKRIHSLIAKSEAYRKLVTHPVTLNLARRILGPFCEKIQINGTQGIQIWPGAPEQIFHRDDAKFPEKSPGCEYMINTILARTKFTKENGCTRFALGSHRWEDKSRRPIEDEISYAEMEPGDAVLFLGSVIHSAGANHSSSSRTGVVIGYSLGWLRQTENQYLVAPPEMAKNFSSELQDLLGYAVHLPNLGMYEGNEPKILFQPPADRAQVTRDWLTPEQNQRVEAHYMKCAS